MAPRELDLDFRVALWAVQALSRLLATAGFLLGLNVVIHAGWAGNSIYTTALMLPGAPPSWGWIILGCSLIIAVGQFTRRLTITAWGHFGASAWAMFFGLSILKSFWDIPTVPTGGVITYGTIALMHLVIGAAYKQSQS
jgi:hypothetical protein